MRLSDFDFDLPEELVAQRPSGTRGDDRLMLLGRADGAVSHLRMDDLPGLISPGTLMVFNNSRVRRARCYGTRLPGGAGGAREFVFLSRTDSEGRVWRAMVRGARRVRAGDRFSFPDGSVGTVVAREEDEGSGFRTLRFGSRLDEGWFLRNGRIPLPPYIRREDDDTDSERYQTVYAEEVGSAACPTAGLHFTGDMLARLDGRGIERCFVTLHVGLGTFLPVRAENIEEHAMHEEVYTVPPDAARKINRAKDEGRPILAVGTTSARTLESATGADGAVRSGPGATRIFIYPGYTFRTVDQLFTNFHTPESTLLMLVSAFAGRGRVLSAYRQAVRERYRFFSYGDCMLIK